jgi:hypothetical protein
VGVDEETERRPKVVYLFGWDKRATHRQELRLLCRNAVGDPLLPNDAPCIVYVERE